MPSIAANPTVAVVGAGAIGAFFAAHLIDAGRCNVLCCVRTPFDELVVESERWEVTLRSRPEVLDDPAAAAGPVDWVLLATKAHQTAGAAGWLSALVGRTTAVVVLQNGVEQYQRVRPFLPATTPVLPGIVYAGVEMVAPGHGVHHTNGYVEIPAGPEADRLAELFEGAHPGVLRAVGDITTSAWTKLLGNLSTNGITALTGRRMDVVSDPRIRDLIRRIVGEAVAAGRAEGARIGDDAAETLLAHLDRFPTAAGTSMLYDREAGRRMEEDALYGAVVRAGRRHGLQTPANATILALLGAISAAS